MFTYKRFFNRYQLFFIPLAIICGGCLVFFMVIIPAIRSSIDEFKEVREKQEQLVALQERLALLKTLDQRELTDNLKLLTSAVPIDKSLPTIMRTIDGLAGETQLTVNSLSLQNPGLLATEAAKMVSIEEKQFQASIVPFTVSLTGSIDQLSQFLERSRSIRRFVRARSFTISFTNEDELKTEINFDSYFSPLKVRPNEERLLPLTNEETQTLSKLRQFQDVSALLDNSGSGQANQSVKVNPFSL